VDQCQIRAASNHYAYWTKLAYLSWARRLIRHDGKRYPQEMDGAETTHSASYPPVLLPGAHNKATAKPSLTHDERPDL
jgi:hypothetical protein